MADNVKIEDGDYTVATADGTPRFKAPFDGDKEFYILEEDYVQYYSSFTALALNTAHPIYTTFYLVKETDLTPLGVAGVVRWTRVFARIPATRSDPSTLAYNFIGFFGTIANIANLGSLPIIGRNRFSTTVLCRVQYDYYLVVNTSTINDVSGTNVFTGTGGVTPVSEAVPLVRETKYYIPAGTLVSGVFTPTYTPGSANDLNYGSPTDNIYDAASWGNLVPTIPTRATYQSWINAKTEIVAETSHVSRWMGNIYARETKYVIAI